MNRLIRCILSVLVLVIILTTGFNTGCSQSNAAQINEITVNDIFIKLFTGKASYKLGEQVDITVYVKNKSSELFEYGYALHKIHLSVFSTNDDVVGIAGGGQKYNAEPQMLTHGTLDIGESITLETFWDQKFLDDKANEYTALQGSYTIKATFAGLEWFRFNNGLPQDMDSVTINITIEE